MSAVAERDVIPITQERAPAPVAPDSDPAGRDRDVIILGPELNEVTGAAINAIAARPNLSLYVRGGQLVTVVRAERDTMRPGLVEGSPRIIPVGVAKMREILDRATVWFSFSRREKEWSQRHPDLSIANQIIARGEWPRLRPLAGVIEAPTIRVDGSILRSPGYDKRTGLLYMPDSTTAWPKTPAMPSLEDARESTRTLLDPVRDFPFTADTDRAGYLALLLSILARHLVDGPVPMFAIRAHAPGTGKTLLAQLVGLIATGRVPALMTWPEDAPETRKRVTMLAQDGSTLAILDNADGARGNDEIANALTTTEWKDRELGSNRSVTLPLRLIWITTGNNTRFRNALIRRVVPIDMETTEERPEDRTGFAYPNVIEHVRERRPQLVMAALTILRAFHLANRPSHRNGARMGSFEAWDDLIRSAVIWAYQHDPAGTNEGGARDRLRKTDDVDSERLDSLLTVLQTGFPNEPFSIRDVIGRMTEDEAFRAALDGIAGSKNGGPATLGTISGRIGQAHGRPCRGRQLSRDGDGKWVIEWMLTPPPPYTPVDPSTLSTRGEMAETETPFKGE